MSRKELNQHLIIALSYELIFANDAYKKVLYPSIKIVAGSAIADILPKLYQTFGEIYPCHLQTLIEPVKLKGNKQRLRIHSSEGAENQLIVRKILEAKPGHLLLYFEKNAIKKETQKKSLSTDNPFQENLIKKSRQARREHPEPGLKIAKQIRLLTATNTGSWKWVILSGSDSVKWDALNIQI